MTTKTVTVELTLRQYTAVMSALAHAERVGCDAAEIGVMSGGSLAAASQSAARRIGAAWRAA